MKFRVCSNFWNLLPIPSNQFRTLFSLPNRESQYAPQKPEVGRGKYFPLKKTFNTRWKSESAHSISLLDPSRSSQTPLWTVHFGNLPKEASLGALNEANLQKRSILSRLYCECYSVRSSLPVLPSHYASRLLVKIIFGKNLNLDTGSLSLNC